MTRSFNHLLSLLPPAILVLTVLFAPLNAAAWTSAFLDTVKVDVALDEEAQATITTRARFVVEGGRFHGFDLAKLDDATLVKDECYARRDGGGKLFLEYKKLSRGRTRITLANDRSVRRGAINFFLVHKSDFAGHDYLRVEGDEAVLDWTPMVWSSGLSAMTTTIALPQSKLSEVRFDEQDIADYESRVEAGQFSLTKYRPVRWYNMRIHARIDASLFPELDTPETTEAPAAVGSLIPPSGPKGPSSGPATLLLPMIATFIALLLLLYKAARIFHVYRLVGGRPRFLLVPSTSIGTRLLLTGLALATALAAQAWGPMVAGIPPLAAAAGLWLFSLASSCTPAGSLSAEGESSWRQLTAEEVARYRRLSRAYRRARVTFVDITTIRGSLSFLVVGAALGAIAWTLYPTSPKGAWMTAINGLVFVIPTWFAAVHAELPSDRILEAFQTLKRWPKSLSRLTGFGHPRTPSALFVLEDDAGIHDIRLRISPDLPDLKHVEIAGEPITVGSLQRIRPVVILRLEAGSDRARRIATCRHAAEHYLTPDLEDEIVILRDRRGTFSAGLAPLRAAIAHF